MSRHLDLSKSVHDLAQEYPEFKDVMVSLGFTDIVKPAALNTVGRVMTVPRGCGIKDISLEDAVHAFQAAGFEVLNAGLSPEPQADSNPEKPDRKASSAGNGTASANTEAPQTEVAGDTRGNVAESSSDVSAEDAASGATSPSVGNSTDPIPANDSSDPNPASEDSPAATAAGSNPSPAKVQGLDEAGRAKLLASYVERLSAGEPLESVRAEFVANFEDVDAAEIARAEQGLIEGGANIDDVQRLCDVHSALFHGATREEKIANAEEAVMGSIAQGSGKDDFKTRVLAAIPGHPVHVFSAENDAIARQIARAREALGTEDESTELSRLCQVGVHYSKKGDLLYPLLKTRHGFSGPSDVMWGVDDEIRDELRTVATADTHGAAWRKRTEAVLTRADEMVYKEANILLPLCVQSFTDDEWLQMYADLKGYDLCLIDDAGTWQTGEGYCAEQAKQAEARRGVAPADATQATTARVEGTAPAAAASTADAAEIVLPTGTFTPAQLDALLNTLPLEITFIDDHEINRYWNDDGKKKLFKRPASALGREVWDCHPPKVQGMVSGVIQMLKFGQEDSVDIWMEKEGEPVLVRYMAVRDRSGNYLGTMECVQRMGFAQEHFAK